MQNIIRFPTKGFVNQIVGRKADKRLTEYYSEHGDYINPIVVMDVTDFAQRNDPALLNGVEVIEYDGKKYALVDGRARIISAYRYYQDDDYSQGWMSARVLTSNDGNPSRIAAMLNQVRSRNALTEYRAAIEWLKSTWMDWDGEGDGASRTLKDLKLLSAFSQSVGFSMTRAKTILGVLTFAEDEDLKILINGLLIGDITPSVLERLAQQPNWVQRMAAEYYRKKGKLTSKVVTEIRDRYIELQAQSSGLTQGLIVNIDAPHAVVQAALALELQLKHHRYSMKKDLYDMAMSVVAELKEAFS